MFRRTISVALTVLLFAATYGRAREATRITLRDGLVWADVDCGGTALHFVVDTGAASSCIDLAAARRLGMRFGAALNVACVGGRTTGRRCGGFQATVGGMRLPGELIALDLSGPAAGCSEKIDGLIGADFFRGKVVRIDYARGTLSREAGLASGNGMRLRFSNGVMCAPVAVNGGEIRWARLDTGCTEALFWCKGVDNDGSVGGARSVALASFTGGAIRADITVGRINLRGVPVKLRGREIFPGEAGLLGNAALSKFRVTIDGINRQLVLEPAS
jgi:hypothetical protein